RFFNRWARSSDLGLSGADLQIGIRGSEDPRPVALWSEDHTQRTESHAAASENTNCLRNRWARSSDLGLSGADLQSGIRGSEDPRPVALWSEDHTQRTESHAAARENTNCLRNRWARSSDLGLSGADLQIGIRGSEDPRPVAL